MSTRVGAYAAKAVVDARHTTVMEALVIWLDDDSQQALGEVVD
jgi:hypothetical protein